jgi:hypothetical protein
MKYLITENRLVDFVEKYLEDSIGRLRKFPIVHINAREDDFELVTDRGETIFTYLDYHLGVEEHLFYKMMALFNLEKRELEKLLEKWFEKKYPDNMVITAYPIIE